MDAFKDEAEIEKMIEKKRITLIEVTKYKVETEGSLAEGTEMRGAEMVLNMEVVQIAVIHTSDV